MSILTTFKASNIFLVSWVSSKSYHESYDQTMPSYILLCFSSSSDDSSKSENNSSSSDDDDGGRSKKAKKRQKQKSSSKKSGAKTKRAQTPGNIIFQNMSGSARPSVITSRIFFDT